MSTVSYETRLTRRVQGERGGVTGYWKWIKPEEHYVYENPEFAQPSECVMLVPQLTFEKEV